MSTALDQTNAVSLGDPLGSEALLSQKKPPERSEHKEALFLLENLNEMWGPARQTSWLLILIKILHYATRSLPLKEGVPATWRHVLRAGEAKNLPAHLFLTGARSNSQSRAECYAGNARGKSNRSTSEKSTHLSSR